MRLSTQNLLACPSNACTYPSNYPLSFRNVSQVSVVESEPNEAFLRNFVAKIDYAALRESAKEVKQHSTATSVMTRSSSTEF